MGRKPRALQPQSSSLQRSVHIHLSLGTFERYPGVEVRKKYYWVLRNSQKQQQTTTITTTGSYRFNETNSALSVERSHSSRAGTGRTGTVESNAASFSTNKALRSSTLGGVVGPPALHHKRSSRSYTCTASTEELPTHPPGSGYGSNRQGWNPWSTNLKILNI